ncbi:flagellar motor protein MotB [Desulfohalovibrio reitneri]|uniref:flagellar motor protein MotB n=1 Tax=Desulfohalovibrio reitneri TaxID=1307759 RepID=UPI0004A7418D|nr:OmpA family protein [Desulfohalovibrio reitneri]
MARQQPPPPPRKVQPDTPQEAGGAPEWMSTFADMAILLMCFFVLLLSFAEMDIQKFKDAMGSMKDAFGVQTKRPEAEYAAFSPSKLEAKGIVLKNQQRQQLALARMIKRLISQDPDLKERVKVSAEDDGVLFRVNGRAMFEPGTAKLMPGARKVLDKVVRVLKEHNYDCIVEGHTAREKSRESAYPTGWELSAARAASALRYIHAQGISTTRLKAVGYADSRPLVPNDTERNRELNRRVEFFYRPPTDDFRW